MSLELPFKIRLLNPAANIDERYGPHLSIQDALNAIGATRDKGLTVGILNGSGQVEEYWFKNGITDADLILKTSGGSGGSYSFTNGLTESSGTVRLGGLVSNDILLNLQSNNVNDLDFTITDNYQDITFNINADRNGSGESFIGLEAKYDDYFQYNLAHQRVERTSDGVSSRSGLTVNGSIIELDFSYNQSTGNTLAVLRDELNLKGIEYDGDYSDNWTEHSLVTKGWVESQLGESFSLQAVTENGNSTTLNIVAPAAPTVGNHLTNKTYVDNLFDSINLSNFYTKTETDSLISTAVAGLASEEWVLDQNYLTIDDLPPAVIPTLQQVTDTGSTTDNRIVVVGSNGSDVDGLQVLSDGSTFGMVKFRSGDDVAVLTLNDNFAKLQNITSSLLLQSQTSSVAGAVFGNPSNGSDRIRVAGAQAVNSDEFVTKQQMDTAIGNIPIPANPTLQSVTSNGNSTSNSIQVTGLGGFNPNVSSTVLSFDGSSVLSQLGLFHNSFFGGLQIEESTEENEAFKISFSFGNSSYITFENLGDGTIASFAGNVSGSNATQPTHFVTKQQLDAATGVPSTYNLTGDVTGTSQSNGNIPTTISNGAVTFAKFQSIPQNNLIGRIAGGVGVATNLTTEEVRTMLLINNVDNTSDLDKPISTLTQSALDLKVNTSSVGQANGVASLDSGGKVPANQLPSALMTLEGQWDASTNTPTLTDGLGDAGQVYEVTVAGTQNLGSGNITFAVGDWVVYGADGKWYKSINTSEVTSVNGLVGTVQLNLTLTGGSLNITGGGTAVNLDSRYALSTRTLTAGVGLSGGGNLTANRTISLGTPSSITPSSTNNASGTTHTHAISGFVSTTNDGGSTVANLTGLDANTITYTNMIYGGSWSNTPTPTGYLQTLRHPNPVETGSSAQIFWNQANNTFHWRTQTAGVYASWMQAADRDWVTSQIPAVQTLSFSSVYDSTLAQLSISGGNSVLINSLRSATRQTHDQNITQSAFQPYTNSAGSTGYPSTTGSGIVLNRLSTATNNSGFNLWTSASSTDELRLAFISGNNVYSNWYTIATREWTNANLLQLGDAIQNVSGVKYFTNFYIGNSSTQNVSYGISALGVSGAYGDLVESDLLSDAKFSKSRTDYYTFAQANTVTFPNLQTKATSQGSAVFSYARFETKKVWTNGAGVQFAYPYGTTESVLNKIYFRASTAATSGVWTPWYTLATREYIQGGMGFGLSYNSTNDKFELGTPVDAGGGTIAHVVDYGTDWLGFGDVLGGSNSTLLFNSTQFNLVGGAQVGGVYSNITGSTTSLTMRFVSTGGTGRGIIIANGAAPALQGDYSSIYTDRSIVDKAYVDLRIASVNVWSKQTSGLNTWYKFTDLSATGITGGLNSVYMGNKTSATTYTLGQESTTIGGESAAQGLRSVSIGYQNTVVAAASFGIALGSILTVSGINDVAIGQANTVNGGTSIGGSIAIGKSITVTGSSSYAFGNGLTVSDANMTVIGTYNDITGLVAGDFVIGCGISDVDRRNALKINTSRQATFYGIASYNADYSASFTARTLVDKGYVDGRNWYGTQAAYDAIATKDPNINYFIQA